MQPRGTTIHDVLSPNWREPIALSLLLIFYITADTVFHDPSYTLVNIIGPLGLVAILSLANWRMLRLSSTNIWTALFWFRLSTSVYFGLGCVAIFVMNNFTRSYVEGFFRFYGDEVYKLNLIIAVSVILVIVSSRLVLATLTVSQSFDQNKILSTHQQFSSARNSLLTVALVFLICGLLMNYLVVYPIRLGWSDYQLPGSIRNLARLSFVGIFLLTLWSRLYGPRFLPIVCLIVAMEMVGQFLIFAKSGILLTLIMFSMAFLWGNASLKRLTIVALIVVTMFSVLQPVVSYGRGEVISRYGANKFAGPIERFQILRSYFTLDSNQLSAVANPERQGALSRISYVNASTFAIQLYDIGQPADWPELLPAVFVPRIIWPEKPIITNVGIDLNYYATGLRSSSTGAGLFADAYWANGWLGIFVFMTIYGAIVSVLTLMTNRLLMNRRWIFFPVILQAMLLGFRTDGHFISDVAGASVIIAFSFVFFLAIEYAIRNFISLPVFRYNFGK